jgi:hypothetical protein
MAERAYDLTIVCAPDFDFVQDGTVVTTRSGGGNMRGTWQSWSAAGCHSSSPPAASSSGRRRYGD